MRSEELSTLIFIRFNPVGANGTAAALQTVTIMRRSITGASEAGFSLIELITVTAILGLIVAVSTPGFINFQRSGKLKGALHQFSSDARAARQRAVTRSSTVRMTFPTGANARRYQVFESYDRGTTWVTAPWLVRDFDESVSFASTGFEDTVSTDSLPDIVFQNTGTVSNIPADPNDAYVILRSSNDIPIKEYTVRFSAAGRIATD